MECNQRTVMVYSLLGLQFVQLWREFLCLYHFEYRLHSAIEFVDCQRLNLLNPSSFFMMLAPQTVSDDSFEF